MDENLSLQAGMNPDGDGYITQAGIERLEGEGTSAVKPSDIEKMTGPERDVWVAAMKAELQSVHNRDVVDEATNSQLSSTYWSKGIRTKTIPVKLVTLKKPLHDGEGGWKAKARVVCCGNVEPGSVGKDL